jgi:hypothetical protein
VLKVCLSLARNPASQRMLMFEHRIRDVPALSRFRTAQRQKKLRIAQMAQYEKRTWIAVSVKSICYPPFGKNQGHRSAIHFR